MESVAEHVLIRDVGLSVTRRLDKVTLNLAARLGIPHVTGAGGEEDFIDKDTFQRHIRRINNRNK